MGELSIDFTSRFYVIKHISIFMCSERCTHNSCNSLKRISFNTRLWRNVRINRFVDKSLKVVFTGVLGRTFLAHNNSATITLHTRYLVFDLRNETARFARKRYCRKVLSEQCGAYPSTTN